MTVALMFAASLLLLRRVPNRTGRSRADVASSPA
jgi:hypothetical protein